MTPSLQKFGNTWTQDKLERVSKYLHAYSKIMSRLNFQYAYIDGFAGTGYRELKLDGRKLEGNLLPEIEVPEVEAFLAGSARIALKVEPAFKKYIFIEKCPKKAAELERLRDEFHEKQNDILVRQYEANEYLQKICLKPIWKDHRAVLFIDPFGMQLSWETLKAVASTKAIDTWILFPVGAVNRLLKRNGEIPDSWRHRLDTMFGASDWYDVFFPRPQDTLFSDIDTRRKQADMKAIGNYFNDRLTSIFADVAPNPYTLRNTQGAPLFLLCFAIANPEPKAKKLALKIAQDILKREPEKTPFLPMMD
jgi:three-Cys-motif partner protein